MSKLENEPVEPFDPKLISIITKPLLVQSIITRLKQETIRLAPKFQRKNVWKEKEKCRLIESLMLNIPLQMFYVSSDEQANYDVVDGLQRLSALRDFIFEDGDITKDSNGNGFKLDELEFLKHLEGKKFKDLDVFYRNRILETELSFTIINPSTPEDVKFTIFSRVNTGGLKLTDQEVRHAMYNGNSTILLQKISENDLFKKVVAIKSLRMEDREFILQTLSFLIIPQRFYKKNKSLSDIFSETMLIINAMPDFKLPRFKKTFENISPSEFNVLNINELENKYMLGLTRSYELFGEYTFRKSLPDERKTRVNKYLAEVWIYALANITELEFNVLLQNKITLLKHFKEELNDKKFSDAISRYGSLPASISVRHERIKEVIAKTLG